jgi:hypothetical protein
MLHPLSQRVADQADMVSLAQFERRRTSGGLRECEFNDKDSGRNHS